MSTNRLNAPLIVLLILTTQLGACLESPSEQGEKLADASQDTAMEHAKKHLDPKYVCPMHAQIVRDQPGTCPICGMDLVEKVIASQAAGHPTVTISNAVINSLGVRTATAARQTLWRYIQTVGRVDYDETRLAHVHPRAEGWMEELSLRAEGDPVEKGQLLGQLYSPEILSAQVDYLIALDKDGSKIRLEKARNRLRLLGVTEATITAIQKRGESQNTVPMVAPASGVVTKLGIREGMYVKPEMEIVTIADLESIWVLVDVYEHQIDWLARDQSAEIRVPAYPGQTWEGTVEYIYPELDPKSRTLKVRLAFDNPDGLLKANMFADVVIYGGPRREVLAVPAEAVIETGERDAAWCWRWARGASGQSTWSPACPAAARWKYSAGSRPATQVVISGQFLIDSESSLQASFLRMAESEQDAPAASPKQ